MFASLLSGCSSKHSVYEAFRDYRIALQQEPEQAISHFVDDRVAGWMQDVLSQDTIENLLTIENIRRLVRSGERVQKVHRIEVGVLGVNRSKLTVYFSNEHSTGLEKIAYEFLREDGKLKIEFVNFFFMPDTFGEIPDTVIDDFSVAD